MEFRILGPLEVIAEGQTRDLGALKQRTLLAALLLEANRVVPSERLIDALWEDDPPETARKALQVYVSELRRVVGKERLQTKPPGYVLRLEEGELDLDRFQSLRADGRLAEALALWRGPPLADFRDQRFARPDIARLDESRLACLENRIDADLAAGGAGDLIGELEALVQEHPLRQHLREQLMLALYRSGRDAEALAVYQDARHTLVEGLGIEPRRELRELQQAILRQDPALAPAPAAASATEHVFVGRHRELEQLRAGLDEAFAGRGRLFLLAGEPGIGKSRLAEELVALAKARGADVLIGRCWEAGGAPAYWPWLQALRTYLRGTEAESLRVQLGTAAPDLAQLVPELRERIPDLPPTSAVEAEDARFRLFDAVVTALKGAGKQRPLLLVLDDLHAADEPSLLLLRFVARELGTARVLVVGAYRDVDPKPSGALVATLGELTREPVTRILALGGLGDAEVARFVELTTARVQAADVIEAVLARTEGNPLFVSEVVRLLEAAEPAAVPRSLKDLIARRLRLLSAECSRVLSTAAVIGREFDLDLLATASGLERGAVLELIDEAISYQLVSDVPGNRLRLRFVHALFRDGMYDELAPGRRRRLHEAVGGALERGNPEEHLAELAHHFCEAVPTVQASKAVHYARRAGEQALRALAPEEAARLYATALSVVDDRDRPQLLLDRARSMWMAGATAAAEQTAEARRALRAAGDPEGAAEAELLLASIHWFEGQRQLVSADMRRAFSLVQDRPVTRTTADVLDHASRFHMLADQAHEAISVGREGLAIAEQLGLEVVRAHCLCNIGVSRVSLGDLGGLDDLRRAFDIAVAADDGWAAWRARVNLADCLLWHVGDADGAFAVRHELRDLLHAAEAWPVARWNYAYDAAESYWSGRWAETIRLCDDFIAQVEAGNAHNTASEVYALRALVRVSRGDDGALADACAAVALGRRSEDPRILYPAVAVNAQVAAELGRGEEADRLLTELLTVSGQAPFPSYVVALALAALARGRGQEALAQLERAGSSPWADGARAMLRGEPVEAADRFAQIGVLPEEARARLLAAEAGAADGCGRCRAFFEQVGASAYLRRLDLL